MSISIVIQYPSIDLTRFQMFKSRNELPYRKREMNIEFVVVGGGAHLNYATTIHSSVVDAGAKKLSRKQ
ncbi:hypothetical protein AALP_AA7G127300 [Arabis alpina]|uniref:Uncharacterized protein n=1 Tax=Arabis alpina TaxID=50452 RepID=A0A087GHN9_ARAAL|nr:hypothetical protein AALP_AA7G127300 [Arabis alpina]